MTQVAHLTRERLPMMAVVVPPLPRREVICGGSNHKFHSLERQQPNNTAMAMTPRMEKSLDTIANFGSQTPRSANITQKEEKV
jgi:hypothetical protein